VMSGKTYEAEFDLETARLKVIGGGRVLCLLTETEASSAPLFDVCHPPHARTAECYTHARTRFTGGQDEQHAVGVVVPRAARDPARCAGGGGGCVCCARACCGRPRVCSVL
jgi:hypothetical protein